MPNSLSKYHPKPCANCGHRDLHGSVAGCIAVTGTNPDRWCVCAAYVHPRDRARDQADGQTAGAQGADAALHGHALTHDPSAWRDKAEARLDDLIKAGKPFTSEDVIDHVGVAPSPSAIGGLFQTKAFKDRVTLAGIVTATRPEARGRALRQWVAKP